MDSGFDYYTVLSGNSPDLHGVFSQTQNLAGRREFGHGTDLGFQLPAKSFTNNKRNLLIKTPIPKIKSDTIDTDGGIQVY